MLDLPEAMGIDRDIGAFVSDVGYSVRAARAFSEEGTVVPRKVSRPRGYRGMVLR